MAARNAFGQLALDRASANGDAHLVGGTKLRYRREFNDPTLADWDVVQGAGMGVSAAAGVLSVTTGTTINSVSSLTTKQTFTAPFKAAFGFRLSQKIANMEADLELVAVNTVDGTTPDELVVAAWRISGTDSTTTTIARYEVRNGAAARLQSGNVTVAAQTADSIYEIVLESDEVSFHNKGVDSSSSKTLSGVRNSVAPDPNRLFKLRMRFVNGGTAPASTSTFTISFVTALDYTETLVEITGAQGSTLGSSSLGVNITGGSVGLSNGTIGASATVTGTSSYKLLSAASTNATSIKASAGRVYGYHLTNTTAAMKYVRVYNKASAPTVGTDSPAFVIPIAPNSNAIVDHTVPISLATGIAFAITNGAADLDATAVAANDVVGHILWL